MGPFSWATAKAEKGDIQTQQQLPLPIQPFQRTGLEGGQMRGKTMGSVGWLVLYRSCMWASTAPLSLAIKQKYRSDQGQKQSNPIITNSQELD